MKQFQCALTADAPRRLENVQLFDSLVVQVEMGEVDEDEPAGTARPLRAVVFLHGKMIARSEWQ